jgi:hypothetical protein
MDEGEKERSSLPHEKGEVFMDWRLTATTLFCETVKRWVPIMVYKDGKTNCGYYYRHQVVTKDSSGLYKCHGPQGCSLCEAYKEDVFRRGGQTAQEV